MSEILDRAVEHEVSGAERLVSPYFQVVFRFVAAGLANTAFGYAIYVAMVLTGIGYTSALAVATVAGVAFNFQTSRRLVFRAPGKVVRFVLVYAGIFVTNWLALRVLVQLGVSELTAQAIVVLPIATASFFGQRFFVFSADRSLGGASGYEAVMPPARDNGREQHWILVDGHIVTTWRVVTWDAANGTWRDRGRRLTPEEASRRRWRYSGPVVSAADLPLST